jgi:hypothetical protein
MVARHIMPCRDTHFVYGNGHAYKTDCLSSKQSTTPITCRNSLTDRSGMLLMSRRKHVGCGCSCVYRFSLVQATMAFKTTQMLAAAMLLSMAVTAMAAKQDGPQAETSEAKKYHSGEHYPKPGEHYPPSPAYPKPGERTLKHSTKCVTQQLHILTRRCALACRYSTSGSSQLSDHCCGCDVVQRVRITPMKPTPPITHMALTTTATRVSSNSPGSANTFRSYTASHMLGTVFYTCCFL